MMTAEMLASPVVSDDRRLLPSAWVVAWMGWVPRGGRVFDVACGSGRHARLFAENGFQVVAVDSDATALAALANVANIEARCADLEFGPWPIGHERFDGIVVTNYLYRPTLDRLYAALQPDGIIIYETFMRGNERIGRPSRPEYLLEPNELRDWARRQGMDILAFEESEVQTPRHAVVQRLCARRTAS